VVWTAASFAAVAIAAAGASVAIALRNRAGARAAARCAEVAAVRCQAVLVAGGVAACIWDGDDEPTTLNLGSVLGLAEGSAAGFADILRAVDGDCAAQLQLSVDALRRSGTDFMLDLRSAGDRRTFRAIGRRDSGTDVVWLQDISRDTAVRAAFESESATLRGLVEALPVPVWRRDESRAIVDCNQAYVSAVEAPSRAAVIDEHREITTGVIAGAGRGLAGRASQSGAAQSERHHVVVGGARRMLEFWEAPLTGGGTAGLALDFSDVYEAQSELSRHVSGHGEVLENLTTAIIIYGPDKKVRFFNSAYTRLWQLDEAWLHTEPEMGEVLEALRERRLLPETADFPAFKRAQTKLFTSLIESHEELVHQPNGTTLRMRIVPHPLGGLLFTYEDVTDKLALERSYNTLIQVQSETLNNMSEGLAVFGSDGRIKLSNPVYARMWQLSEEFLDAEPHISEVLEAAKPLFRYGDDWPTFKADVIGRVTGREIRAGRLDQTDGSVLQYGFTPLPDGAVLASYLDITDSIRVERALRERAEALETADTLKSEFIANVSYELRTPLNTIIGFTEILDKQYFGELNERQKEYAEGILESSRRLLAMINDILDLATIEAGRMMLDVEPVDIRTLLDGVMSLSHEAAREHKLEVVLDCDRDIGVIEGDERRLKHALVNLVGNAIKFTSPGGMITLTARRDDSAVTMSVVDNGIGIPDEDRERVFEKFVRGKSAEGRSVGAGLGLPLVKSLIELHGGTLSLDSEPETGTKITCRFPLANSVVQPEPATVSAPRRAEA